MIFENPLREGTLVRRYKRFLADVKFEDDSVVTIHCPNTGSMTKCSETGSRVWFSRSNNEKRKHHYIMQIIQTETNDLVDINTNLANDLVLEAISNDIVTSLNV